MLVKKTTKSRPGFTLVELLVVLVLFALIAATIAPNLSGTTRQSQINSVLSDLVDLDAKARVLAGNHQACYIKYDQEQLRLQLIVIDKESVLVQEVVVPDFIALNLDLKSETINYNRLGQTTDYVYRIETSEAIIEVGFNGLSGWHEIQRGVVE